ncbi:MAG: hypothetical protein KIT69_15550 [Propionibacteriaceae bacterium]|nr:hypothetical protein [Propionibacteriaceae bacterium]
MPTRTLITEALPGQPQATGEPGRYMLRIITAGEGSSAIYTPEALQQAAADRVFAFGTHMHLDHPTKTEERESPVRSMKDLAGVFIEDAVYTDDEGGALDVPIKVAAPYQPLIADLWEHIGASIRALVEVDDGKRPGGKPTARKFLPDPRNTVDFVTVAGRGGRVMEVLESASAQATEATTRERREQLQIALKAAYAPGDDQYVWVRDFDEEQNLVWFEDSSERCWQQKFTPAADDLSVALAGDPIEVRPTTTYVPVNATTSDEGSAGQSDSTQPKESLMDINDAELAALRAEAARAAQLQAERDQAMERATTAESERDEIKTRQAHADAVTKAMEAVKRDEPVRSRIREALEAHTGDLTDAVVEAAVKREDEYLAAATGQRVGPTGFGKTQTASESARPKRTRDAWGDPKEK